jgi:hypothetical protein
MKGGEGNRGQHLVDNKEYQELRHSLSRSHRTGVLERQYPHYFLTGAITQLPGGIISPEDGG